MTRSLEGDSKKDMQSKALKFQDVETAVISRYAAGANTVEPELCCPVADYDSSYIAVLPQEILDKDYGCGDPSKYVEPGETVVDLGSGAGKICYILAQKVGAEGEVIGLDFNDAMLKLASKYKQEIADKLGYENVSFRKARIQDMALDLEAAQQLLDLHPVSSVEQLTQFQAFCEEQRISTPLINSDSVDVIVSNCVLNLVKAAEKQQLFQEMFRVVKRGGRVVISDIVCDEEPTEAIMQDPELWSGCIAGAFREDRFLAMFQEAGFHGIEILARSEDPWKTIDGIEFRSMTVRAFKGKQGPCLERNQAVVYRGPWSCVLDDDDHKFVRGERTAVCDKTYHLLTDPQGPYADAFYGVEPIEAVPLEEAQPMECVRPRIRHPRESKGQDYRLSKAGDMQSCCGDDCC